MLQTLAVGEDALELAVGLEAGDPPAAFGSWPGTWLVAPMPPGPGKAGEHPWPALVSVGVEGGRTVLANLEAAGSLSVHGRPEATQAALRSMAVELATSPWASRVDLALVGFDDALAPLERSRRLGSLTEAARELSCRGEETDALLDELGVESLPGARLSEAGDAWAPTVVLSAEVATPEEASALVTLARPGGPMVVVAPTLVGARWRLDLSEPLASLDPLGLRLWPTLYGAEAWEVTAELLAVAADVSDVEAEEPSPSVALPEAPATGVGAPPDPDALVVSESSVFRESFSEPSVPEASDSEIEVEQRSAGPEEVPVPAPADVEVAVLGLLELRGAAEAPRRPKVVELIAYLAMADRPVATDTLRAALWGAAAEGTAWTTISRARQVLGKTSEGRPRLPRTRGGQSWCWMPLSAATGPASRSSRPRVHPRGGEVPSAWCGAVRSRA